VKKVFHCLWTITRSGEATGWSAQLTTQASLG
jgi:hypothetical protein